MKIIYKFNNGESVEVEVNEEVGNAVLELRKREASSDRKYRRHCVTFDVLGDEGKWASDEKTEPFNMLIEIQETEYFDSVMSKLTVTQREVIEMVYMKGISKSECAKIKGVSPAAITRVIHQAKNKLKKFF